MKPLLLNDVMLPDGPGDTVRLGQLYGCARALSVNALHDSHAGTTLVVTGNVAEAENLVSEIRFFNEARSDVHLLPDLEVLAYDEFSPHQDLISRRLAVLRNLTGSSSDIVVAAAAAIMPRLPPRNYLTGYGIALKTGQTLPPDEFRRRLDDAGYQRVNQVGEPGDYAVRGSLIDFFPSGHHAPVRVDFFDDQIETLREFDPDSQTSTGRITFVDTLPARDIPIDENAVRAFRQRFRQRFEGNPARSLIYREVTERRIPAGVENYLPLFFDSVSDIWGFLPEDTLLLTCGDVASDLQVAWSQVTERYEEAALDTEQPVLKPEELFLSPIEQLEKMRSHRNVRLDSVKIPPDELSDAAINLPIQAPPNMLINHRDSESTRGLSKFMQNSTRRVLFTAESAGRRELLIDTLRGQSIESTDCADWPAYIDTETPTGVMVAPLERGAIFKSHELSILTESELFGIKPTRRRRTRRVRDPEALISDLTDLRAGAPVVHSEHGIGRYVGLSNLDIDDQLTEFLTLEYADGDRLHVPVTSLHLISRYTGAAPDQAPLHRLGSDQWSKARRKAAEKIRDVAAELLELYAKREARAGISFDVDLVEMERFADGFPFAVTDDQAKAIAEVTADLVQDKPMDRLVCGDVGFGKTEVALRAAFVAAANSRQVAILVPTTLLAQQHFQVFADRFADWPINVAVLSRFQSQAEANTTIAGLASGQIDIVIGTHRLLQRGVEFKNLGLIIIDEEHRFGVRHKERLKSLRTQADILTLTATPIPRTLNMALGSLRELSLITTPPQSRLAIKTFVTEWNERTIRESCQRELKRGGQVYFVHNRIEDIDKIARTLEELLPDAKIQVAHGQMRERDLERIMDDFYHRRFHILVCTAIIESGLDVPSANTILINRADRFGLAQLHQLRGRVGRSHHQAFAYLLAPPKAAMTADAQKRLDAIESLEDLGAGFVLATHDLEIRGAGELLGEGQSGQIHEIGFSLYNEMLTRTVTALRAGAEPDLDIDTSGGAEINLHIPTLLPDDYMPDVHLRLVHYKRIANARDDLALEKLQVELIDRFGLLPEPTRNLFSVTALRLRADSLGIRRLELSESGGLVEFTSQTSVDPALLVQLLESQPDQYRLDRQQRLRLICETDSADQRFDYANRLIDRLSKKAVADAANNAA